MDYKKIGKQIALLRKEKNLTGEKLAEIISVSPQAISKWENGKCLPETSILPRLSKTLGCSIDSILLPKQLQILNATYSDGVIHFDITQLLNSYVHDNKLSIVVNNQFLGYKIDSQRLKILTVKFQSLKGVYYLFALQDEILIIDIHSEGYNPKLPFKIVGAYYGNYRDYNDAMIKIDHYDYYNWKEIYANQELFPSSTCTDEIEYLTIIYTNKRGIYVVSCEENEKLCYNIDKTKINAEKNYEDSCILPNIMTLQWHNNMDCTWAGALYAALKYMKEDVTYEQLMGISGACYRIAFTETWDWSSVDALVIFDYAKIAYKALGYELIKADRIKKSLRKDERERIIKDINNGKPPIAINLRIAPEWGVITGYIDKGKRLLCRTYFDNAIFNMHKTDYDFAKETGGYLETDWWPFSIAHFGKKLIKPDEKETLFASLKTKVESMKDTQIKGYYQGYNAYKAWIKGLEDDTAWMNIDDEKSVNRRLAVNDYQLINLIDARRCATEYLKNSISLLKGKEATILSSISNVYSEITYKLSEFYKKIQQSNTPYIEYNCMKVKGVSTKTLRNEEIELLKTILKMEYQIDEMAKCILTVES